jgi:hypothetical protein
MNLIIILVIAVVAYFIFIAPKNNKNVNIFPITPEPVKADIPVKKTNSVESIKQQQKMPNTVRK